MSIRFVAGAYAPTERQPAVRPNQLRTKGDSGNRDRRGAASEVVVLTARYVCKRTAFLSHSVYPCDNARRYRVTCMNGSLQPAQPTQVSSPYSTGGGGTSFEHHVAATFLSVLLIRGIPPIIHDCILHEVDFQTERMGWQTDDMLLQGRRDDGFARRVAIQAKRSFTLSVSNNECQKAITDFWRDFNNTRLFDRTRDCLALVVQRGTDVLLDGLGTLLDCARACKDPTDFNNRLRTSGLLSKRSIEYADHIRKIVQQVTDVSYSDEALWAFLKSLHLLSYDLATSTSQTEAAIRNMLAFTATGRDKATEAKATWNELVACASTLIPNAASVTFDTLPESARNRHTPVTTANLASLHRLANHSATVLSGIRMTLGGNVELSRDVLIGQAQHCILAAKTVLITGPAGFGKSVLARTLVARLASDSIILAFRAEEFAVAHLDHVLHSAQVNGGALEVFGLLAGQGRKVLHVESVERLLESPRREAFLDLLRLIASDSGWRLILTCRDYSADTVKAAFLDHVGLEYVGFSVPELSDDELDQALVAIPSLRRPASHPFLNKLFRNPYYLDKASAMSWPTDGALPADERAFRDRFWQEVVRRNEQLDGGMPTRRERALIELCVRRARALEPWVSCSDLDPTVMDRLRNDNLITFSRQSSAMAAPVHDALEDWVVLHWIGELYTTHRVSFVADLGTFPAIRRAYRKWLGDQLDAASGDADDYVTSVIVDESLPAYFRDDTLVAALLAPAAADFLTRTRGPLLNNNGRLLCRVIQLLRVAGRTVPSWVKAPGQARALSLVPFGSAWPAVLRLLRDASDDVIPNNLPLVVGLLDDWVAGVSIEVPMPPGVQDAAHIAHRLLPHLDDYSNEEMLRDVLNVILKVPGGDPTAFAALARRAAAHDRQDHAASRLAVLMLTGLGSGLACMIAPDVVIEVATAYFRERERDPGFIEGFHTAREMEHLFGLNEHLDFEFSEASAIRGPFLPLLRFHPCKGMAFILDLMNRACENFAMRHMEYIDPPWEITLTFPDGGAKKQWCEDRLWNLYRGTSVGPHVLQCALMALEAWLLEVGELAPQYLERWLMHALRESNNVAVTSVVASVSMAFPLAAGEAALALLGCRDLVRLDKQRCVQDLHPPSQLLEFLPVRGGEPQLYADERRASDGKEHRKCDLEWVAIALAASPWQSRVYAVLDSHRATLPPENQQDDMDRLWRFALHRMDFRRYRRVAESTDPPRDVPTSDPGNSPRRILMSPQGLEGDLDAFVKAGESERQRFFTGVSLLSWAMSCAAGRPADNYKPEDWRRRLAEAQEVTSGDRVELSREANLRDAPGWVAAVCARDHWDEMSDNERKWVLDELDLAVRRDAASDTIHARIQRNPNDASRPAAYILSRVLSYEIPPEVQQSVRAGIVTALTHPCDEVVAYAASGVGAHLVAKRSDFLLSCVGAIALRARLVQQIAKEQESKRHEDRLEPDRIESLVREEVKAAALSGAQCTIGDVTAIDLADWWGAQAISTILSMLGRWPQHEITRVAFSLLVTSLAATWCERQDRDRGLGLRHYEMEDEHLRLLAEFCLRLPAVEAIGICKPMLGCVETCPDEVESFVRRLTIAADQFGGVAVFWALWEEFAKRVAQAQWVSHLDRYGSHDSKLLSAMFLGLTWKEGVSHWGGLEGYASLIDGFFLKLPPTPTVFGCYARFLYEVGERSLPNAFVLFALQLRKGDARKILSDRSLAFTLESLLCRWVYSAPAELKSAENRRGAVLHILDELVTSGSSAAYRMRDDFVTPGLPQ